MYDRAPNCNGFRIALKAQSEKIYQSRNYRLPRKRVIKVAASFKVTISKPGEGKRDISSPEELATLTAAPPHYIFFSNLSVTHWLSVMISQKLYAMILPATPKKKNDCEKKGLSRAAEEKKESHLIEIFRP